MEPQDSRIDATTALEHLDWVRGLARGLVRDASLADDIAQETWLAALRRPAAAGAASKRWLARVARNVVRQENRRNAIRSEHEERARSSDETASTDELVDRVHTQRTVVDAVLALDPPYKRVILLRYFEGLTPREIARRQGAPVATVKTRLQRGLALLREALDREHGGGRATWMPGVAALTAPVGSKVGPGTLVIGGMVVGTTMKVSAAVLVAAVGLYFATRTPGAESPPIAEIEPRASAAEPAGADPSPEAARRRSVAEEPPAEEPAVAATSVLRLVVEGVSEEEARKAAVTLTAWDEGDDKIPGVGVSWPCQGGTSEYELDPFFASVAERDRRVRWLDIEVDHPEHLLETVWIAGSDGVESESGQTVYEARVTLTGTVFWPELTLDVRDARTRAHLEDVELHCIPTSYMGLRRQPPADGPYTELGAGLSSPIVLQGGHEADEQDLVAAVALRPGAGVAPRVVEVGGRVAVDRGVVVYARAPGYEWGRLVLDFSTGAQREILLGQGAELGVQLTNVQLERYAELEREATLFVYQPGWGVGHVWVQRVDETLATEGLWLEGLEPGDFAVAVELGGEWSAEKRIELAREELSLAAGETRELVLALPDPPARRERATLGGVVSFPAFGGEDEVLLRFYDVAAYRGGPASVELPLADLDPVGGGLPSWSFRVEDLPVGPYHVKLWPFLTSWRVDVPAGGLDDVQLVVPELAEVLVDVVDARTGERLPLETIRYGRQGVPDDEVGHTEFTAGFEGELGRFHFWTASGPAYVRTFGFPDGFEYGMRQQDLELVPGRQTVRFELEPVYAFRFEFRVGGAALPHGDQIYYDVLWNIRPVDHEGRVIGGPEGYVEVSAPGLYEVDFEGLATDRFLPIPTRRIDVQAGEAKLIVELQRK